MLKFKYEDIDESYGCVSQEKGLLFLEPGCISSYNMPHYGTQNETGQLIEEKSLWRAATNYNSYIQHKGYL